MNTKIVTPLITTITGFIVLVFCFFLLKHCNKLFEELTGIIRVVVALSTAAISISLPGFFIIGNPPKKDTDQNKMTLEERIIERKAIHAQVANDKFWSRINAGGALAVFVVVYLLIPFRGK